MNQWLGRETCWEDIINLHNQPCVCMIGLHWSEQKTLQIRNMNKCIWKANGYCNHFESQSGTGIFIINTCLTIKFPPQSHHPRNLALASVQHAVWSQSLRPSKGWWSTTQRYTNLNSLMSGLGKKTCPCTPVCRLTSNYSWLHKVKLSNIALWCGVNQKVKWQVEQAYQNFGDISSATWPCRWLVQGSHSKT